MRGKGDKIQSRTKNAPFLDVTIILDLKLILKRNVKAVVKTVAEKNSYRVHLGLG